MSQVILNRDIGDETTDVRMPNREGFWDAQPHQHGQPRRLFRVLIQGNLASARDCETTLEMPDRDWEVSDWQFLGTTVAEMRDSLTERCAS